MPVLDRELSVADAADSVARVVEYIFERYPHTARNAGRHDFDGRLPDVTSVSAAELERLRADVRRHADALGESPDPELRADLDASERWLDHERFRVLDLPDGYPGPLDWLAEADVWSYLRSSYAPLPDRLEVLQTHLLSVPGFLEQAAQTLAARLPAGERLRSIEQARARAADITSISAAVAAATLKPAPSTLLAAATAAAAACEEFATAVEATAPASGRLGPDLLAELLRTREGIEHPLADLLLEAEDEVGSTTSALDSAAARLGVSNRLDAYALVANEVSDASVVESMLAILERLEQFWADADVVPMRAVNPLEVQLVPWNPGGLLGVFFQLSSPHERPRRPHILYVPEPPNDPRYERVSLRRQYCNDAMLEVIAVHEAFPGHYLHAEAVMSVQSVMRTCIRRATAFSEGWAHYAEELAIDVGLADDRPLIEIAQLKSALEAATRLLIFLSIHMGRWSFAQAVDRAAELNGWSSERAAHEVLGATSMPDPAMYTLGKLRIREWRRATVDTSKESLKEFHGRLLQCGFGPLTTVWRYYLDGQRSSTSSSVWPEGWPARGGQTPNDKLSATP